MTNNLGRLSRSKRMGGAPWHFVALDHGIGLGLVEGQESPASIAVDCCQNGVQAVVCHSGLLDQMTTADVDNIFLQLFGNMVGGAKVRIAHVEDALRADCVGVAVELRRDKKGQSLKRAAEEVSKARRSGLLTLVMVGSDHRNVTDVVNAVVAATQIGADFIKIGLENCNVKETLTENHLKKSIRECSPILLAGGMGAGFEETIALAESAGFLGTCVGRRYFDSPSRKENLELVMKGFPKNG